MESEKELQKQAQNEILFGIGNPETKQGLIEECKRVISENENYPDEYWENISKESKFSSEEF